MQIRILITGISVNPGGIGNYIMNLYRNADRNKFKFDFLVNCEKGIAFEEEIKKNGDELIRLCERNENPIKHYYQYNNFFKKNSGKYDVVYHNVVSLSNIDVLMFAAYYGIKVRIVHAHNSNVFNTLIRKILINYNQKRVKKWANIFFACSEQAGRYLFKEEKFIVIKNAIDVEKFSFNKQIREAIRKEHNWENKLVIGNVGNLIKIKNPMFSIEVFNEVYKRNKNAIFIHAGIGEEKKQMEKRIEELGLNEKYILLGPRKDIAELYQGMDAFLFPSISEGFGIALLEAQTAGLPCYISTGIPEEVNIIKEQVEIISLEQGAAVWATHILEKTNKYLRKDGSTDIRKNGYDSKSNIEVVCNEIIKAVYGKSK